MANRDDDTASGQGFATRAGVKPRGLPTPTRDEKADALAAAKLKVRTALAIYVTGEREQASALLADDVWTEVLRLQDPKGIARIEQDSVRIKSIAAALVAHLGQGDARKVTEAQVKLFVDEAHRGGQATAQG